MPTYKQIRNNIGPGDVFEFAGTSLLAKDIRVVTGKKVNHTGMAIWLQPEAGPEITSRCVARHRLYVGEAIGNGFRVTFASRYFENYDGKICWLKLKEQYRDQGPRLQDAALNLEGIGYDWLSLVRNLWRRVPLDRDRLYCSETVHAALIDAGMLGKDYSPTGLTRHQGCGMRPGEFGRTGLFEEPIWII